MGLVAADPAVPFCAPAAGTFGAPAGVFDVAPGDLLLRWGRARARVGEEHEQREREKSIVRKRDRVTERRERKRMAGVTHINLYTSPYIAYVCTCTCVCMCACMYACMHVYV